MNKKKFIQQLVEKNKPVQPVCPPESNLARYLLAFLVLCLIGFFILRASYADFFNSPFLMIEAVLIIALLVSSSYYALRKAIPGEKCYHMCKISLFCLIGWFGILIFELLTVINPWSYEACVKSSNLKLCPFVLISISLIPLILIIVMVNKAFPLEKKIIGFMTFLSAGAAGSFIIHFFCQDRGPMHLIINHFLPVVLFAIAGIIFAHKFFKDK